MNGTPSNPPVIPEGKTSALAIWSLVLGILGLMCFTIFTAIPGVVCGHKALGRIKSSGGAVTGKGLAIGGLVTGYVAIAWALVFIPMMLAIAIPNFVKARATAQKNACINNLREIDAAKQEWLKKESKPATAVPTAADLDIYFHQGGFSSLRCPAGGTYTINAGDQSPTCSVPDHALPSN